MYYLLHDTLSATANRAPDTPLLIQERAETASAAEVAGQVQRLAATLRELGLRRDDRVGVYLPKQLLTAYAFYAISAAGGVFVPINPVLKPAQVQHILNDCDVRFLVTSPERTSHLAEILPECPACTACS